MRRPKHPGLLIGCVGLLLGTPALSARAGGLDVEDVYQFDGSTPRPTTPLETSAPTHEPDRKPPLLEWIPGSVKAPQGTTLLEEMMLIQRDPAADSN